MSPKRGFTLIELLVVITIIVVLLSLLTPALDKAIYQAELAACAAGANGIGKGVMTYAYNNKRSYPYRNPVHDNGSYMPRQMAGAPQRGPWVAARDGAYYDERPMLSDYVPLDAYACTLAGDVSISSSLQTSWIMTARNSWYGYQYFHSGAGMLKAGRKLSWNGRKYGVLTGDLVELKTNESKWTSAHPDSDGLLVNFNAQDQDLDPITRGLSGHPEGTGTVAEWGTTGLDINTKGGFLDLNFCFDDGGVSRYTEVWWDLNETAVREENRFDKVPWDVEKDANSTAEEYLMIPNRR